MEGFIAAFPEFDGADLYITGESYSGKYIPYYAWKIWNTQKQAADAAKWNLKACLVGDPYTVPLMQRSAMWINPEALNILDETNLPQIQALINKCEAAVVSDIATSADACSNIMGYIEEVSGGKGEDSAYVFPYDARIFAYDWDPKEDIVKDYFNPATNGANTEAIFTAIHVADSTKSPVFEMSSSAVGEAFEADNLLNYN